MLSTRPSARASALGGAYVALGDDVSAISYNPSAIDKITGPSLSFLHYAEVDSVSLENLDYAQSVDFGTFGGGVVYRGEPAISNPLATDAPVVAWDLVVSVAYAVKLSYWQLPLPSFLEGADGGIALKYVQSQLGTYTAYTGALDAGIHVPIGEGILLGVSALNLGPAVKYIAVSDPLPATVLVGVSRGFDPVWESQINVAADLDDSFLDSTRMHFGLEDWVGKTLALRAGYLLDSAQSLNGWTAGFGILLDQEGLVFHLDYALLPFYYSGFGSYETQQQFQMSLTF